MTDVVNPKSSSPDQLLPYHKKISAEDKALMVYFISYTYMVLKAARSRELVKNYKPVFENSAKYAEFMDQFDSKEVLE